MEVQEKPRSVVFKDAEGTVVTSIPIDTRHSVHIVELKVSASANMAYVLNPEKGSKERSLSAVNLATMRVDRVINVGTGNEVDLLLSHDGSRLFCYTLSRVVPPFAGHRQRRKGSSSVITVIDTRSNEVVGTFDLLHYPGVALPKAEVIESFLSATSDGGRIFVRVNGIGPKWQRLVVFSVQSPNSTLVINPNKPILSYKVSENNKFLFVAAADKDRHSEVIDIVNLETGTTISRAVDDPPTREERLGAFLMAAPPSGMGSTQGIWIFTRAGLRFVSEDGQMGNEIPLPREDHVSAILSRDKTLLFLAIPDSSQNSGALDVVDLSKGISSSHPLADAPIKLVRLGTGQGLWIIGSQEMRPVSEAGEPGDRAILLNKPPTSGAGDTTGADVFLNGHPGEAIGLGEDHAAILITNKKGGSLHRVALLDLKQLQMDSIVTTMNSTEQSKIVARRWLEVLGVAALEGAAEGAIGAGAGIPTPTTLFPVPSAPRGLANESLAAGLDGRNLYVLDTDVHKVSVVDVQTAAVVGHIPVHNSVALIQVTPDGKHLYCAGTGFFQTIDLESNKKAN